LTRDRRGNIFGLSEKQKETRVSVELAEYNEKLAEYREYMDLLYYEQG
jgi:hypothetical protein